MKLLNFVFLIPVLCHAQIETTAGDHFNCDIPLQLNVNGNINADEGREARWVEIPSEVRDLLFDGCENSSAPDASYTGRVGESYWLPFSQYYTGTTECSDGLVSDLPPGMSSDSLCNIYGSPDTAGTYLSIIKLDDGSLLRIEFTVNSNSNTPQHPDADDQKTMTRGVNQLLIFNQYYKGSAQCTGTVANLPPGLMSDWDCNIYGSPNTVGVYLTEIELNDGSQWRIEFRVSAKDSTLVHERYRLRRDGHAN